MANGSERLTVICLKAIPDTVGMSEISGEENVEAEPKGKLTFRGEESLRQWKRQKSRQEEEEN